MRMSIDFIFALCWFDTYGVRGVFLKGVKGVNGVGGSEPSRSHMAPGGRFLASSIYKNSYLGGTLKLELLGHSLGVKTRQNILMKEAYLAQALILRLATIWLFAIIFVHFWHAHVLKVTCGGFCIKSFRLSK